jgi:hypothetical protein
MTFSKVLDLTVSTMDNSISEWAKRHPDHLYDKPRIEHVDVIDGVHNGQGWLSDEFFIFVFGESWEEVDRKGKLRWSKICGKPVGL